MKTLSVLALGLLFHTFGHRAWGQEPQPPEGAPSPYAYESTAADTGAPYRSDHVETLSLTANVDHRLAMNNDFDSMTEVTLVGAAIMGKRDELGFVLGGGALQLRRGSREDVMVHQPVIVEFGMMWRHAFTPSHTFLQPYFTANANLAYLGWEYREPVFSGHKYHSTGYRSGADAYAGVGLSFRLAKNMRLFGEIGVGDVSFVEVENRPVSNSLFDNLPYTGGKAGFTFVF